MLKIKLKRWGLVGLGTLVTVPLSLTALACTNQDLNVTIIKNFVYLKYNQTYVNPSLIETLSVQFGKSDTNDASYLELYINDKRHYGFYSHPNAGTTDDSKREHDLQVTQVIDDLKALYIYRTEHQTFFKGIAFNKDLVK